MRVWYSGWLGSREGVNWGNLEIYLSEMAQERNVNCQMVFEGQDERFQFDMVDKVGNY